MRIARHRIRNLVSAAAAFALAVSPFFIYKALRVGATTTEKLWPADVALVATSKGALRDLALLHYGPPERAVHVPIQTVLDVPDSGSLRAETIFRQGGAKAVALAMSDTFGLKVSFWAQLAEASRPPKIDKTNLGAFEGKAFGFVQRAISLKMASIETPGEFRNLGGQTYFYPNTTLLTQSLRDGSTPPPPDAPAPGSSQSLPEPASSPTFPQPATISVEILNQGGASGAASKIGDNLRASGYRNVKVGTSRKSDVDGLFVYYTSNAGKAQVVGASIGSGVTQISKIPSDYSTDADVLVIVGRGTKS